MSAAASPMPFTSSSLFISGEKGLFHSPNGFSLSSGASQWQLTAKPKDNSYIDTIYRGPGESATAPVLTVRSDKLAKNTDVGTYAKKWLNDYPRFGFEVLSAKKVKVNEQVAYLVYLVSRESAKQLRQVLFVKGQTAVTLTCRDDINHFAIALKSCNEIIRTFHW
jgi:hypothetical protein